MIGITKHKRAIGSFLTAALAALAAFQTASGNQWVAPDMIVTIQGFVALYLLGGVTHARHKAKVAKNGG